MIDFPTLFPNLVKYIPNWMERFYPSLAQFARGEGYPCGNKGVFIPRRNKCWTHPKTGQRMRKPLTYQNYQDAKEKSQRSRTEKGRTALANREQSFRDKARERVKGWQNKKVEVANLAPERAKSPNGYLLPIEGDPVFTYTGGMMGSSKWKGKVLKVNPDGKTIVIEKGWEKTKAGKPARMTVNRSEWKVEDDPQIQKDNDRILGEKRQQEVEEEKLLKQSIYSVDNAIKTAIDSGVEKPITRDELKKGDTFYQYLNMKTTGDHLKQEYEYTSDGNAREILPNRKKGSEVRVLTTGKEKITAPTSVEARVGTVKVKIDPKEPAPPTPKLKSKDHAANEKYDQWLISKSQELEGKEKNYNIVTGSGKKSVKGKVYENFGIHEERGRYNLTQLSSGRMLNYYDDEDLAKKSIIELNRSGIDWKLNEKELQNIPGIQAKMKSVKRKIDAVAESDKRAKELIESMTKDHERGFSDRSDDLAGYGVKVSKKQNPKPDPKQIAKSKNEVPYTNPLNYRDDPLDKFDKTLDKEVEKLQQKTKTIPIETLKGKVDGLVSDYGNGLAVWKNKDNKKKEDVYTVVHTPSGKRLTTYDSIEEDQSKRIVAGLTALGVDWTKEEKEFTKDERLKDLNGLMRRVLDSNYRRFKIADKERLDKLRKARDDQDKKNNFNSNLKLAQFGGNNLRILKSKLANFAKPGCCCDASKPLKRRKTKQTPRLKRRGNKYA